ncbi:MAG: rhomboid family intramembrane serine protease [Gammaproteobacteria bacterium]|nr:rhomboid family intramembrane serine protease [Gammaproteobacteria bacterium]
MFIPLEKKPDWHHPPFITIFLVFAAILCFVFLQSDDHIYEKEAHQYYFSSGLAELELPRYLVYLKNKGQTPFPNTTYNKLSSSEQQQLYQRLVIDGDFTKQLQKSLIITGKDSDYRLWQNYRNNYLKYINRTSIFKYGFQPSQPSFLTTFSSLFLHADYVHLIGNLFFLFLFGFTLELSIGRFGLLVSFFTTGTMANLITSLATPENSQWLIGLSGAITGLAGIYIMIYGMQRIRFFYTLIFYFDHVRAPAIVLLPVWLVYELLYTVISPGNVSAITHLGGLGCGLILGYIIRHFSLIQEAHQPENATDNQFENRFQQGMRHIANLEFNEAKVIFEILLQQQPDNIKLLKQLFVVAKLQSDSTELSKYANAVLTQKCSEPFCTKIQNDIFIDYFMQLKDELDLEPVIIAQAAARLFKSGLIEKTEQVVLFMLKTFPHEKHLPRLLSTLTMYLHKQNKKDAAQKYLRILSEQYSHTEEAQTVKHLLNY